MNKLSIRKASGGGYFVRVVATNGNILGHSEVYVAKSDARRCAELFKAGGGYISDDS